MKSTTPATQPRSRYVELQADRNDEVLRLDRTIAAYQLLLAMCGVALGTVVALTWAELLSLHPAMFFAGLVSVVATIGYIRQVSAKREQSRCRRFRDINRQALARYDRNWEEIAGSAPTAAEESGPLVRDLDLIGQASLFQLVSTAETSAGRHQLQQWLTERASPQEIRARQQCVQDLAPRLEWRQELQDQCSQLRRQQRVVDRLISWSEVSFGVCPPVVMLFALASSLLSLILIVLLLCQIGDPPLVFGALMLIVAVHLAVTVWWSGAIHSFVWEVSPTAAGLEVSSLSGPFVHVTSVDWKSPRLDTLKSAASNSRDALRQLEWLLSLANLRRNPATMLLVYLPLQLLFLWDLHILRFLEAWREHDGHRMRDWFDALGQMEALSSLASLSFEHPDWCLPTIDLQADRLVAERLGHPLLPNDERVTNDVTVGPRGTVLLVTGSNMSGKSTLLRAIGVNVMLAQAGGPVCARACCLPPVVVATSMRVSDSLVAGESLFMAEVLRLKEIIDTGRLLKRGANVTMLYLLDEILHGTNSAERRIAVLRVLRHLLRANAIGAISTHDLELAREPELAKQCDLVHLREAIHEGADGPVMSFDYLLRPGCAPTTNALRLVAMLGLDDL